MTVHDISWVERPGDFTAYERLWHRLGRLDRLARRCDLVVVDTAVTAAALTERWRVPQERIRVVRPGIPPRPRGALPPGLPERFFLSVGALEPRKDPELLVRALRRAKVDAGLVFAGSGRLAERLAGPGVTVLQPTADELGALYAEAIALVSSSRLEGFGFPPLEAAAAGTPAVLSDLPVFRETLGDAPLFVPVGDEEAWAAALGTAAREPLPVADVGTYRWERAARELRHALAGVVR
jgi:glycosyltransferase involved in cell wall biosynthesis